MAGGTGVWESRGHVIGIVGGVVVRLVTRVTVGRNAGVVIVDVAHGAGHRRVRMEPGQRKRRVVVIEGSGYPCRGAVAHIALLGNPGGSMIRIVGSLIVLQVTRNARGAGQFVVVVDVTHGTGNRGSGVKTGKRESSPGVIE